MGDGFIRLFAKKKAQAEIQAGLPELYPRLWRFCLVLTRNRHAADDLAQEACLRALDQAAHFQPGTHLDRWVFTLTRRLWLNEIRARKVRQGAGQDDVYELDLADNGANTEMNIFALEVFNMVQALPQGQRMAVLLVYVEGYSYRDASELLDIPIGTIMSRLATARRTLVQHANRVPEGQTRIAE